jgi:RHH-type proline utilization regulon transcriptional repressor/proline dehydrogenase/delta 1-pyrroline-5-carboxylate dehydrogenase
VGPSPINISKEDVLSAAHPFAAFRSEIVAQSPLRAAITAAYRRPEPECVAPLLEEAEVTPEQAKRIDALARSLAAKLRGKTRSSGVEGLIYEYSLSSQEGVALMCLAEALLRIPDASTRDALIRDKLSPGDWRAHIGQSPSLFVNAATWGLVLTGRLVATTSEQTLSAALTRLIARSGEPIIRRGVDVAMRLMGEQFVTGRTIEEAINASREREARGFTFSYDMLGEAAVTADDAARYLAEYERAIHAIGKASHKRGIYEGPGISIKLSALHPRYSRIKRARVMSELLPRIARLAAIAKSYDIVLNIDAEEADRLDLSLDLLEALCLSPELTGWNGASRQGRLLGLGDQTRASGRARGLSRLHPQGPHRRELPRLRAQIAGGAGRRLSAIRHSQLPDSGLGADDGGPEFLSRSIRVPVSARHGRAAL